MPGKWVSQARDCCLPAPFSPRLWVSPFTPKHICLCCQITVTMTDIFFTCIILQRIWNMNNVLAWSNLHMFFELKGMSIEIHTKFVVFYSESIHVSKSDEECFLRYCFVERWMIHLQLCLRHIIEQFEVNSLRDIPHRKSMLGQCSLIEIIVFCNEILSWTVHENQNWYLHHTYRAVRKYTGHGGVFLGVLSTSFSCS